MRSAFRFLAFILIVYSMISGLIGLMKTTNLSETIECQDLMEVINDGRDRRHQRDWEFADRSENFCASYLSNEKTSLIIGQRRNEMRFTYKEYQDLWGTVYKRLIDDSKATIGFLVDSLQSVALERKLSRSELAELVVTFVQDIPYSYILGQDCESYETKGKPCLGNIAYGILSPYEFLHTLYGDCDTRAVLIYTLLEELRFDPMIVVSDEYAHAMLALNIPSAGDHIKFRGKNYYFWETTGTGWPIGMLPPSTNNVNYWKVALVNESTAYEL